MIINTRIECPFGDGDLSDADELIHHIGEAHAETIRPPDVSVIRERLAADALATFDQVKTNPEYGGSEIDGLIDPAMHQIEHLIADRFPAGSHTSRIRTPVTDRSANTLGEVLALQALALVDRILAESGEHLDPDYLEYTLTARPVWSEM